MLPEWVPGDKLLFLQRRMWWSFRWQILTLLLLGKIDRKFATKNPPHISLPKYQKISSPWTSGTALMQRSSFTCNASTIPREMKVHWDIKGRFCKRVVLANVPSLRFSFQGNMRTYPGASFRSGGTSESTLVPVFVPGEHPPKPPFWKTTLLSTPERCDTSIIKSVRGPIWLDDRGTGQWKWLEEVPRRTSLVPLAFPCFVLCLIGLETKNVLDYQGRAGDHFHCTVERSPGHIRCRSVARHPCDTLYLWRQSTTEARIQVRHLHYHRELQGAAPRGRQLLSIS